MSKCFTFNTILDVSLTHSCTCSRNSHINSHIKHTMGQQNENKKRILHDVLCLSKLGAHVHGLPLAIFFANHVWAYFKVLQANIRSSWFYCSMMKTSSSALHVFSSQLEKKNPLVKCNKTCHVYYACYLCFLLSWLWLLNCIACVQ